MGKSIPFYLDLVYQSSLDSRVNQDSKFITSCKSDSVFPKTDVKNAKKNARFLATSTCFFTIFLITTPGKKSPFFSLNFPKNSEQTRADCYIYSMLGCDFRKIKTPEFGIIELRIRW